MQKTGYNLATAQRMVEMNQIDDALVEFNLYLQNELENNASLQSYSSSIILVGGILKEKNLEAAFVIYEQGLKYNFEMNPVNLFEFGDISLAMLTASKEHMRQGYMVEVMKRLINEFLEPNWKSNAVGDLMFRIRLAYQSMGQIKIAIRYFKGMYERLINNYPEHHAVINCAHQLQRLYCYGIKKPYEYLDFLLKISPPALEKLYKTDAAFLIQINISTVIEEMIKGPLSLFALKKRIKRLKKDPSSCPVKELIEEVFQLTRKTKVLTACKDLFQQYHVKIHSSFRICQVKELISSFSYYSGELDKLIVSLTEILSLKR